MIPDYVTGCANIFHKKTMIFLIKNREQAQRKAKFSLKISRSAS